MKPHLHKILRFAKDDIVAVHADTRVFVFYTDEANYDAYLNDYDFEYYGSAVSSFPFYMAPPSPGVWHLVIEQEDMGKDLNVRIEVISEHSLT